MTDIETTLEDCDHVLTQDEVKAKIKELEQLLHRAQWEDAPAAPVFDVSNGIVDYIAVGAFLARYGHLPYMTQRWKTNRTRLWNSLWKFDFHNWRDGKHYTFTKMCAVCECPLDDCRGEHERRTGFLLKELSALQEQFHLSTKNMLNWSYDELVYAHRRGVGCKAA